MMYAIISNLRGKTNASKNNKNDTSIQRYETI